MLPLAKQMQDSLNIRDMYFPGLRVAMDSMNWKRLFILVRVVRLLHWGLRRLHKVDGVHIQECGQGFLDVY